MLPCFNIHIDQHIRGRFRTLTPLELDDCRKAWKTQNNDESEEEDERATPTQLAGIVALFRRGDLPYADAAVVRTDGDRFVIDFPPNCPPEMKVFLRLERNPLRVPIAGHHLGGRHHGALVGRLGVLPHLDEHPLLTR